MAEEVVINEFKLEDIPLSCTWIVIGPPGSGKCKRRGEQVLMHNGEIKKVEDVKIGDLLMGDDSTPREVIKLFQGRDKIYEIAPQDGTKPYYVTGGHTLCLRYNTRPQIRFENGRWPRYRVVYAEQYVNENTLLKVKVTNTNFSVGKYGEKGAKKRAEELCKELYEEYENEGFPEHEVEVEDYLKQPKNFNHRLVGYRTGVKFSEYKSQKLNPYLLGVWLGDGSSSEPLITNIDPELVKFLYEEAERMGLKITRGKDTNHYQGSINYRFSGNGKKDNNPFRNFLKDNNLINNKHIPQNYKVNSKKNRRALLAGLIDTDGHYGNKSYYEIYQKNETLANDIVFVARSLGYWCHIKPVKKGCMYKGEMKMGIYHKVTFGGHKLHKLPILIPRKIANQKDKFMRDPLHYKIKVTLLPEEDDYFGFQVKGKNHRFLLADFTVTHNCLGEGTPVKMFDNTIKNVENIVVGDNLMGDDPFPRKVLSVCSGIDRLYKIKQSNAMDYVVNEPHILVLKNKTNFTTVEMSVKDILNHKNILQNHVGYKHCNSINVHCSWDNFNDSCISEIDIEPQGEGTYFGFQIDGNGRFLLGDNTVTHNTSLIENLCYYHKHRYPVARMFIGTESGYQKFCSIFHPLYVSNYYSEEQEKSHIYRQRTCVIENGKEYQGNYAINILDDVSDDPTIYKTKVMKGLFKLGSQHWCQLFMIGSQYAIDMPPDVRKATSYVALFREPEEIERKKLYQNFGGLAGSYQRFCDLMDQLTGDYSCLIFKKRSQSNELEECVFWYRTVVLKPWKFGCKEYRKWAEERYNKNYVEKIII